MQAVRELTPCPWFDDQSEQAAGFDTGIREDSKIMAERGW
jgi:hypothetical protein